MNTRQTANAVPTDEQRDERDARDILRQVEFEQKRLDKMAAKTAEWLGEDTGDILWA